MALSFVKATSCYANIFNGPAIQAIRHHSSDIVVCHFFWRMEALIPNCDGYYDSLVCRNGLHFCAEGCPVFCIVHIGGSPKLSAENVRLILWFSDHHQLLDVALQEKKKKKANVKWNSGGEKASCFQVK